MVSLVLAVLLLHVVLVCGDTYLHLPRGSNNRLQETTANRRTNNRMFDSQNNNKGGYNVGARYTGKYPHYPMEYFQSGPEYLNGKGVSHYPVEWTNQHGCGKNNGKDDDPIKLNCNMVMQFMCQKKFDAARDDKDAIRDGKSQTRNQYKAPKNGETYAQFLQRKRNNNKPVRGMNEPFESYDKCNVRQRNKGLFNADQKVKNDKGARATRQNNNGNQNGYECPEERDYYPYWHPSDWKDIAILTEDKARCRWYQDNSFNFKPYHECVEKFSSGTTKHYSKHNNKAACENGKGVWREFRNFLEVFTGPQNEKDCKAYAAKLPGKPEVAWAFRMHKDKEECLHLLPKPECESSPYTRVNHLGNAASSKDGINTNSWQWKLPHFYDGKERTCVFRMRYNISTTDYDPLKTDASSNGKQKSPILNDPKVNVGLPGNQKLQLAINTAQTGRTFQDRSHTFVIKERKALKDGNLYNLNVRGKRGNIVQTYPAVEYDFVPNNLQVTRDDLIHIQWTGSNTHNNRNPAGDGQAGDDGEGKGGTDRSNMLSMKNESYNFFNTLEDKDNIACNAEMIWAHQAVSNPSSTDIGVQLASAGYFSCYDCGNSDSLTKKKKMQNQLNNAPASFPGMVLRIKKKGIYPYGCTRNNNFSNRSQKAKITVI